MQPTVMNEILRDREQAGYQLASALAEFRNSNAVVVGIPHGGVSVASAIAESLALPLEVMSCRKIKHPADEKRTIGSVCEDEVFIHDCSHTIPQDYIYHQIALLRNAIAHEIKKYYGSTQRQTFRYRPVILVDDVLSRSDSMMACLQSIRKQNPLKIIVAIPIVAAEAARIVGAEADDMKFLRMEPSVETPATYFDDFPKVDDKRVNELLRSRKMVKLYE